MSNYTTSPILSFLNEIRAQVPVSADNPLPIVIIGGGGGGGGGGGSGGFSYNIIPEDDIIAVPTSQQMVVVDRILVLGNLILSGDLAII